MKKYFAALTVVALLGIAAFVPAAVHADASESFNHYITAQEALAADDFAKAKKAILKLANISEGEFKKLVETAARADDIEMIRKEFKKISANIAGMEVPEGYGVAFCPMADNNTGAYWVQKKGKIMNPYFGSSMLHCGSFKKYPGTKEHKHQH